MKLASAFFALALTACASPSAPAPSSVTRVVSTTSFGMCIGYCTTRLEISEGQAVLIREPRGGRGGAINHHAQPQRFSRPLSDAEWRDIQRLAAEADLTAVPATWSAVPDCADGGAEGLTVEGSNGSSETVSIEFRAAIPQAQAACSIASAPSVIELTPQE